MSYGTTLTSFNAPDYLEKWNLTNFDDTHNSIEYSDSTQNWRKTDPLPTSLNREFRDLFIEPVNVNIFDEALRVNMLGGTCTLTIRKLESITLMDNLWTDFRRVSLKTTEVINKIYTLSESGSDVELLRITFGMVETSIAKGDLDAVNELLSGLEPYRVKRIASIGLARATSRARAKLPAWTPFVVGVWKDLTSKHLNAQHIMRGLVSVNDSTIFAKKQITT